MRFPPRPAHALPKPSFWAGIPQRSADIIGTTYTPPSSNPEPEHSGLSQGPVHLFGGRLSGGKRPQGEFAMSEQAVEERRGWASDIVWVVVYSILVILVMLLWV